MQARTLLDLVKGRVDREPHKCIYTYLPDGIHPHGRLTYEELDKQARAIGATLLSLRASTDRALLLYPPGLEFITAFFGCLYAGVVAVPAPLSRPHPTNVRERPSFGRVSTTWPCSSAEAKTVVHTSDSPLVPPETFNVDSASPYAG